MIGSCVTIRENAIAALKPPLTPIDRVQHPVRLPWTALLS